MASFNKVFLIGNLTRDPELRYTTGGSAVCSFGIAINRKYTTSNGEQKEEVCFVDIQTWGRQAETADRYLQKGAPVCVEGRLQQDQWQDKTTGKNRSRLRVRAQQLQFLGAPSGRATFEGADAGEEGVGKNQPYSGTEQPEAGETAEKQGMPDLESSPGEQDDIPF